MNYPFIDKVFRAQSISVGLGTAMNIVVQTLPLEDYGKYILYIGEAFPTFVGTEAVSLNINGTLYPLIDNAGNVVVSGKLRDGKLTNCGDINSAKYLLQFGSNGLPTAIPHFVVHRGLCPMIYNGTAGSTDNVTPTP